MDFMWALPIVSTALSFVGGLAGAYFGGYLRKKGENLATHEDIRKLTDQVAAVTITTEQIKTEISDAAWNRQKRWELKRDLLLEATRRLAEANDAVQALCTSDKSTDFDVDSREVAERYKHARDELIESIYLASIVCEVDTQRALLRVVNLADTIYSSAVAALNEKGSTYVPTEQKQKLTEILSEARRAIRKELGTEEQE